jgi:hypothetical protein
MASPYDPTADEEPGQDVALDPRSSLVRVRIGGTSYDAVYHRTCRTCTHPARALIEEKVLQNFSYPAISELFSGREVQTEGGNTLVLPDVPPTSIRNHYRAKHMPLEFAAARRLADQRADALGDELSGAVERIVETRDVVQMILERGHDQLVTNSMEVDAKDTLAAAKLLADLDERAGNEGATDEAWGEAMQVFFEVTRRHVTPDVWERITRQLAANPVLRALEARQGNTDGVIDAEFTES